MNAKYIIWTTLLMGLVLTSCLEDKSTEAINAVSRIEVVSPLNEEYSCQRWATFTLNAPEVKQTNANKPLEYEWQVDYKTVGNTSSLSYVCERYGTFPIRLKITNGDEIKYLESTLNVPLPYGKGLYALAEQGGKVIMSYQPVGVEGKQFALDVLADNNKGVDFSGSAEDAIYDAIPSTTLIPAMFISMSNPNRMYTLHADSMLVIKRTTTTAPIKGMMQRGKYTYMVADGELISLGFDELHITNNMWRPIRAQLQDPVLSPAMTGWHKSSPINLHGLALWDDKDGRLVGMNADDAVTVQNNLFPNNPFAGYKLHKMVQADGKQKLGLFLYKEGSTSIYHALVHPGFYKYSSVEIAANVEHKGEVPATAQLTRSSAIVSAPAKDIAYYSSGANIFGYSLKSKGNFDNKVLISLSDANSSIVDMLVSADEKYLYVAANSPSGTLVGSLYCYDLTANNKLVWEKKNVTGKIKKLLMRPE